MRAKRSAAAAAALLASAAALGIGACGGSERRPTAFEAALERARTLDPALLAGQRVIGGFEGTRPPRALRRLIRDGRLAGVILFEDNLPSPGRARRLAAELQAIPRPGTLSVPLLVMVDQEGGPVRRLPGPPARSAEQMGAAGTAACADAGNATGRFLARTGVNVDLAPVLDVARPGGAIGEEGRSFGSEPDAVASCGEAFAAGLEAHGVAATAKHFPGIGAARVNTDDALARLALSRSGLRAFDARPFARFVAGGTPNRIVMLASAIYPAFGPDPAALTPRIATGELRKRLGFEGVSITDALETASTEAVGGPTRFALRAAKAGADLLLFTSLRAAKPALGALRRAAARDRGSFAEAVARVLVLREGLAPDDTP